MKPLRKILFIMCDQLRWDYISCNSGGALPVTPHIDSLAARGTNFKRAYAAAPICGPSRMSFYTGRYVNSHGCFWNGDPLRPTEWTLADYLAPAGMRTVLVGKTDIHADEPGLRRLQAATPVVEKIRQGGFEAFDRDDGIHLDAAVAAGQVSPYNRWLATRGYGGDNPWHHWANSVERDDGNSGSGWLMQNAAFPAKIQEEDSETAYQTMRAIEFIENTPEGGWCAHLSYNKPHWPYIAPAPYHGMFAPADVRPAAAAEEEKHHPVQAAFMRHPAARHFSDPGKRATVAAAYMALVKQIDDHIGKLLAFLTEQKCLQETMIIFTSDHGDYLGDHGLGEKYLLHDAALRVPLIIVDPRSDADPARGNDIETPVQTIDLCPTLTEAAGGAEVTEKMEGRSLLPLLRGEAPPTGYAFAESNYSGHPAREILGLSAGEAHCWMVTDSRHKYILHQNFPAQLFDLQDDPDELRDIAAVPAARAVREKMQDAMFRWFRRPSQRTTVSPAQAEARAKRIAAAGIRIGWWDENG